MLQCGSNVAFALEVNSARNVVVRRNTLRYGCTAYGFGSTTGLVFEHNNRPPTGIHGHGVTEIRTVLSQYRISNISIWIYLDLSDPLQERNVQTFGVRQEMTRMFMANNTQVRPRAIATTT